ncbi:amidase [Sandarakinorhabdus limnophila]|uniref:amidase n=1 Tax=Sandarakinorhabdus limnophila TaxID=210512 RepID=UPI0026ED30AD|nr:amidase family protein [Sandarakinorhabdus limnophila]MCM0032021.1 amidase family protein [Sandarakinorhabdus limnophila]
MAGNRRMTMAALLALGATSAQAAPVEVAEASILQLQAALASGAVTSRQLVQAYLARIAAYDSQGPALNSIVTLNPAALAQADALDKERASKGPRGPLHGIPVLVKDNFDTKDMPTSGGALALATLLPAQDAHQVDKLRSAGAIILGKTAMHELAAGTTTISSLTGQTRNPYDLLRSPGGSSGGTGAAIAASFAAAGMGSDTCGSIRIPAAYQNLFGLRTTRGLASRTGVIPLSDTQDVAGPLARSVADLAIMLDATVGSDSRDAITAGADVHVPRSYADALQPGSLKGARIGVLRSLFTILPEDGDGKLVYDRAITAMRNAGAEVIEVAIPGLDEMLTESGSTYEFVEDLRRYLAAHPGAPVASLEEIVKAGLHHDQLDKRLRDPLAGPDRSSPGYQVLLAKRTVARAATDALLTKERLDALLYPTALGRPPVIGAENIYSNCRLSVVTGLPALAIPAGFTPRGLPVGLELLGAAFAEPRLLALGHGWEQLAKPRQPPFSTPPLVAGKAPGPQQTVVSLAGGGTAKATIRFSYDPTTARMHADVTASGTGRNAPIAVALHRSHEGGPGPILVPIMLRGQKRVSADLVLDALARADLAAGRLAAVLYTAAAPLGTGRTVLAFKPV